MSISRLRLASFNSEIKHSIINFKITDQVELSYSRSMETLISKWVRETIVELDLAKKNQNLYKMKEMIILKDALYEMRAKLLNKGKIK